MKAYLNNSFEGPVYSVDSPSTEDDKRLYEDDKKLYELSVQMQQLATNIKTDPYLNSDLIGDADELADTVLEFLKVSGWSR